MWEDPIVEEIRKIRDKHAAKFNYDIAAIVRDLQEKQKQHPERKYVDLSSKTREPVAPSR